MASDQSGGVFQPQDVPTEFTLLKNPEQLETPTVDVKPRQDENLTMRAVEFHAKMQTFKDMRVFERPKCSVTDPADVVLKVTTTFICGSDLHMYCGYMPGMKSGDVVGHEFMGIIDEVGPGVKNFKKGDRVVASALIACFNCWACKEQSFSLCETTNPSKETSVACGDRTGGIYGYCHLTGGYDGGQAEYVRVPMADNNLLLVPDGLKDEQVIFLSDILPTGWHANELARVGEGDNVAIWGCGPVGMMAATSAFNRGANRVVVIDSQQYRLDFLKSNLPKVETINRNDKKVYSALRDLFPHGPDVAIEAAGFHYVPNPLHKVEVAVGMETYTSEIINELIYCVRKGGRIGIVGDYITYCNHFNLGAFMEKGLTMAAGQVYIHKYWPTLLSKIESGEIDPSFVITHTLPLGEAPKGYQIFDDKVEGCVKGFQDDKKP
uniref:Enoyl reductase (ER) domain-containing protein n=2 Tax=Physcomitrium patens TaxID=3218 RepID=A0A7I4C4Q5_PHYPA